MEYKFVDREIVITSGDSTITLSSSELRDISESYDKEVYYREDVMNQIEESIKDGDLPESARTNTDYIEAVLDKYDYNRREHGDGTDDCWSWIDCLNDAFDDEDYDNYVDDDEEDE